MLVVWSQAREDPMEDLCESAVTKAAIGSPSTGFTTLGTVSPEPYIYFPAGAFIDEAGDAWVIGGHEARIGSMKYGPLYAVVGAWVTYRPADGGAAIVPLPIRRSRVSVEPLLIAGNAKGEVLLAWSTQRGTYLAWDSAGVLSKPSLIGRGFTASSIGVAESGSALLVGFYWKRGVKRIATVTLSPTTAPSKPRTIALRHRHRGLERPLAGFNPDGAAVIAWATPKRPETYPKPPEPDVLVDGNVDGSFSRPKRFASNFLQSEFSPGTSIAVDASNEVTMIQEESSREREITLNATGKVTSSRQLGRPGAMEAVLSGFAQGALAIGWTERSAVRATLANPTGEHAKPVRIATSEEPGGVFTTIDANGSATVGWLERQGEEDRIEARALPDGPAVLIATTPRHD